MKLIVLLIFLVNLFEIDGMKIISSSSRQLNRRETNLVKRLVKRQIVQDSNCDRRLCLPPNCGKDFVAAALPGECCEKCVPWEYASSLRIPSPSQSQSQTPNLYEQRNSYQQYQPVQQQQQQRVDVYIYGPDEGARVSSGQSIYFDCEVISPYNQYVQPRWSRSANQALPYKVQSTTLPGNRKLARLTIPDATQSDAGRYECSAGTGNPNDQTSIDLQVIDGGYYPRPVQPQYPSYPSYNQYPYNPPAYYPSQPQPQPQLPADLNPVVDHGDDEGNEDEESVDDTNIEPETTTTTTTTTTVKSIVDDGEGEDEGEYPEDYTENE